MTAATHLYRIAAHAVAPILAVEGVSSVYVRRSVAGGDARFPWSDLDLGVVMEGASGADLLRLWKRWRIARAVFPRLGEGQIFTPDDFAAYAETDPYRASLDRRFGYVVFGERPVIPERVVDQRSAARRLAFWFQRYLPDVIHKGRVRDQRKIALEMYNALGVLEQHWAEPLPTRIETEARARDAGLLTGDALERPFAACSRAAERACELLAVSVPTIRTAWERKGLLLVPQYDSDRSFASIPQAKTIVTPAALQLLLEMHDPFLWLEHEPELAALGFTPPSRRAWLEASVRASRADLLRTPGFMRKKPAAVEEAVRSAEQVVTRLEGGDEIGGESERPTAPPRAEAADYYRHAYDALAVRARDLHRRAIFHPSSEKT